MATLQFDPKDILPLLGLGDGQKKKDPAAAAPAPDAIPPTVAAPQPPPTPMPTPAQAGFTPWATDPATVKKIADGITAPGQPLIPPSVIGADNTNLGPTPLAGIQPMQSAAAAPPAVATPPPSPLASVQPLPGVTPATPVAATPASPMASIPTLAQDQAANPDAYQKNSLVGRGWGRALAVGGVGALQSLASGLTRGGNPLAGMSYVTDQLQHDAGVPAANANIYDIRNVKPLRDAAALADTQSQTQLRNSQAYKATQQGDAVPDATQLKRNATLAQLAKSGQVGTYDKDGNLTVADDPNSEVFKSRQVLDQVRQSKQELQDAQTAFTQAKGDPNSPLFKQTAQRLAIAQQNATAAATRAQAYMGNYLKGAFNVDTNGNVLPGAPKIADDDGNQTVVGATNAPLAVKNQSNAAQFNDVHGALDSVEQSARNLVAKGGSLNSPGVAAALSQPSGTLSQWMQGAGVKANLSPEERAYVQSIASAHENIQALRKSAGGTATDSAVAKLDAMIPGVSTPDLNYLLGQTGQIRATAERLGKGATTAAGGLTVLGQQGPKAAAPATYKATATGADGHKIGTNDGKSWFDVKTGKAVVQ